MVLCGHEVHFHPANTSGHLQCPGVVLGAGEWFRIEPTHYLEEGTIWLGSQSHERVTPVLAGQIGDRGIRGRGFDRNSALRGTILEEVVDT